MPQGIHRDMHLGTFAAFVAVVTGAGSAVSGVDCHGAPVEDDGRGLTGPPGKFPQHHSQVVRHRLKTTGSNPAQCLLMNCGPRRQIVGQQTPRTTRPHHPSQGVEDRAQRVLALRRLLFHQGQISHTKLPLLIGHIGRVAAQFSGRWLVHPKFAAPLYSQSTDLSAAKVNDTL